MNDIFGGNFQESSEEELLAKMPPCDEPSVTPEEAADMQTQIEQLATQVAALTAIIETLTTPTEGATP